MLTFTARSTCPSLTFHPAAFALVTPPLNKAEFNRLDLLYGDPARPEFAILVSDEPSDWAVANERAVAGLMRLEQRVQAALC